MSTPSCRPGPGDPQAGDRRRDRDHHHRQARPVPADPNQLTRIKDGPIIDAINAAWTAAHPGAGNLIVAGTDDDLWQSYLSDRSQRAADFVADYLWTHSATGVTYGGGTRTLPTPGWRRSTRGRKRPSSSACRSPIRAIPTCSVAFRSAWSTPAGARSPNTAAATPAIVTCRSSSTRPASSAAHPTTGSRPRRSRPRSCGCSGSTPTVCRQCARKAPLSARDPLEMRRPVCRYQRWTGRDPASRPRPWSC